MPAKRRKRRKPKPIILPAIRRELGRLGLSQLWLSRNQKGAHSATCQAYLYSGRDARTSTVEAMMRRLGLVVISGWELDELRARAAELDKLEREAGE